MLLYSVTVTDYFMKAEVFLETVLFITLMVCVCVCLPSVLEPPVLLHNLTDCNVNVSSSVTLSCPAQGIPLPTITWYKNEMALSQGSGMLFLKKK